MPDGTLYPSGNVSTMRITGYADLFGVNPGNKLNFTLIVMGLKNIRFKS